jgi:type IV pilus assembly protein PilB
MLSIPQEKLKEMLVTDGAVAADVFDAAEKESGRMGGDVSDVLIARNAITQKYYFDLLAKFFAVERATLVGRALLQEVVQLISEDIARSKRVIVFGKNADGSFDVAMENPVDLEAIEYLKRALKAPVNPYLVLPEDMNYGFTFYGRRSADSFKKIIEDTIAAALRIKNEGAGEAAEEVPIVAIVDTVVSYAISSRASDIHIEPQKNRVIVRFRIDGMMHEVASYSKDLHDKIISRLKIMSRLRTDEHGAPQDGRFLFESGTIVFDAHQS